MSRLTIGTLLGVAVATAVAWQLGGALGGGVMGGFLMGASLGGFALAWQLHLMRTQPSKVQAAMVSTFLVKLGVLLSAALLLRYVEPLGRHADWRSFLVSFALAVLVVLGLGSLDAMKIVRDGRAARTDAGIQPGEGGAA